MSRVTTPVSMGCQPARQQSHLESRRATQGERRLALGRETAKADLTARNLLSRPPHRRRSERSEGWRKDEVRRRRCSAREISWGMMWSRRDSCAQALFASMAIRSVLPTIFRQRFFLAQCSLRPQSESRTKMEPSSFGPARHLPPPSTQESPGPCGPEPRQPFNCQTPRIFSRISPALCRIFRDRISRCRMTVSRTARSRRSSSSRSSCATHRSGRRGPTF